MIKDLRQEIKVLYIQREYESGHVKGKKDQIENYPVSAHLYINLLLNVIQKLLGIKITYRFTADSQVFL